MERRRSERKVVSIKAELVTDSATYTVFIENINKNGLYIVTKPERVRVDFTPGKTYDVRFETPSNELINLHCRVVWSYKTPPHGLTDSVGMEIIDPPAKYREFINNLRSQ
jgi:hypothetical protein